jgi:hypothetical protein
MIKNKSILITSMFVLLIIVITIGYTFFEDKTPDINVEQQDEKTEVPVLISQLYSASIPRDFDEEENNFVSLRDGKIEIRGPQILEDGTTDKDGPQDLFHWGAYLKTDNNNYSISDFNNDGLDDVAIVVGETGGGSGFFSHIVIFMNEAGRLKYLTSEFLGDRIKINKISYASGTITTDIITQGPDEGYCCGTMPQTLKYKLEKNKLVLAK